VICLETKSPDETWSIGFTLGLLLQIGDVVTLNGGLGAGKTCFAGGVAKGLGVYERITSPTFSLINEYHSGRLPFYHLDVYRLTVPEELIDLGYEEYFYGAGTVLIEWAEKIKDYLPEERLDINFVCRGSELSEDSDDKRRLLLTPHGVHFNTLLEELIRRVNLGH